MTIHSGVVASGLVAPAVQSKLNFRIAGTFVGYKVAVGDHVSVNQPLAAIDAPDQDLAVAKARHDVAVAQAGLTTAQAKLDAILNGPRPEVVAEARAAFNSAQSKSDQLAAQGRPEDVAAKQAAVDAAEAKLQALRDGPRPEQVQVWKAQVDQAKDALLAAQLTRDAACASKGGLCDAANAAVNAAQDGLNVAGQQLAANVAPPTATQLNQAKAELDQAQQALAIAQKPYSEGDLSQQRQAVNSAEQALRLAQQPYTDTDRAQGQAAVDQAQAELEWAQASLTNAQLKLSFTTLLAPYAGTVLAENAKPGETVGPDGVSTTTLQTTAGSATSVVGNGALLLASDDGAEINLTVSDADLARIHVGQQANVGFGAFPGQQYQGAVSFVPDIGDSVQNVQQYVVRVRLKVDPSLPAPKAGMTADCEIPIDRQNVLAVPSTAILHDASGRAVVVMKDAAGSGARNVRVETGSSDAQWTEILSGLKEGDRVLLGVPLAPPPSQP